MALVGYRIDDYLLATEVPIYYIRYILFSLTVLSYFLDGNCHLYNLSPF